MSSNDSKVVFVQVFWTMKICLHWFVCLFVCLFACFFLYYFVRLFVSSLVESFVCLFVCLIRCLFVRLFFVWLVSFFVCFVCLLVSRYLGRRISELNRKSDWASQDRCIPPRLLQQFLF